MDTCFYEFYEYPRRASGNSNNDIFNDKNRRMGEGFSLANQLRYFGKSGYLATITSESENDIVTEKAVGNGWMGGLTQHSDQDDIDDIDKCGGIFNRDREDAIDDAEALRSIGTSSDPFEWHRGGENYSDGDYVRNIIEKYWTDTSDITISSIAANSPAITPVNPPVITTSSAHGLNHDDIIRISDIDTEDQKELDGTSGVTNSGYYRVRVLSNTTFHLVDIDTRQYIPASDFNSYTASSAEIRELEGIQNEYYRATGAISNSNDDPQHSSNSNLVLFFKDPKISRSNNNAITGTNTRLFFDGNLISHTNSSGRADDTVEHTECSVWRWITGPEQFLHGSRGLAFSPTRRASDILANNGTWEEV